MLSWDSRLLGVGGSMKVPFEDDRFPMRMTGSPKPDSSLIKINRGLWSHPSVSTSIGAQL